MQVNQVVNSVYNSNTYVISKNGCNWVWLIDIGEIEGILKYLDGSKYVKGVFITHSHIDHIYGINKLVDLFPDCIVYISDKGKEGLASDKMNLSFYHEDPVVFNGPNIKILKEEDNVILYENVILEAMETPGHNQGCLTFKIGNYIFTGDSYIPGYEVVTKLKDGNREASLKSLVKIKANISPNTIVCPGHGEMKLYSENGRLSAS